MTQREMDLLIKLFDTNKSDMTKLIDTSMEDIRRTIAVAASNTDTHIQSLDKTIKEHNGRLKDVEEGREKDVKILTTLRWVGKHWYITIGAVVVIILILIPVADVLGLKGILSFIKPQP